MPATLLLAPAAYGKTAHVLDRIRTVRAQKPLAPIVVILPNKIQLDAFEDRLARSGGALGVSLLTFYDLYAELLARAGRPVPQIDGPAQIRLIRLVVDELCAAERLPHFVALRAKPGFATSLRDAFRELKQARITDDAFAAAARGLGPHLE